ncbi:GntR family transcriptional regulator [Dickeya solani]|uniref:HTH-type transcriptional regulator ydfH n=1 Tax=Dickeya solani D s0432-1 TaxID=1231725 RepID=A0AAV3KDL5_9GAMM|nr:GntR family transcriptional regulator [Dickeya solani]ANE77066.1 GntR family transcriptional regulator [Dickeya solani IPO 2222]AUC44827.1 Transcriptional regulator, GntR family [Dickeya solani RNS 08.23.3.1.A]AUH07522.1 GntR family transcriptional regulator [Dickeya solani D s0432-1]AUH11554.1 GntR family transcriptional regulator [Dickeya solani]AYQ47634.1 putative HTH-type transcriptional regulator YdfH [Dickeya solani]
MSDSIAENMNSPINFKAVSLNERAYLAFKHRLITLRYKPGEYLNTAQVMDELEMGRTPVNQAIHRLATEGLLQIIPRKGVMVSPLSIDDALELIEVRLVNETLCLRLATQRVNPAQIAFLRDLNQRIASASEVRDRENMMLLDREFHQTLADIAGNSRLSDILSIIHAQAQRFWATTLSSSVHMLEVIAEHDAIISALEKGDANEAQEATRIHINSFKQALLKN